jgi:hypothetical protein
VSSFFLQTVFSSHGGGWDLVIHSYLLNEYVNRWVGSLAIFLPYWIAPPRPAPCPSPHLLLSHAWFWVGLMHPVFYF